MSKCDQKYLSIYEKYKKTILSFKIELQTNLFFFSIILLLGNMQWLILHERYVAHYPKLQENLSRE